MDIDHAPTRIAATIQCRDHPIVVIERNETGWLSRA
jgi:hypothetical protein